MTSNIERFQEIQKQVDSESYSYLCHLEPRSVKCLASIILRILFPFMIFFVKFVNSEFVNLCVELEVFFILFISPFFFQVNN